MNKIMIACIYLKDCVYIPERLRIYTWKIAYIYLKDCVYIPERLRIYTWKIAYVYLKDCVYIPERIKINKYLTIIIQWKLLENWHVTFPLPVYIYNYKIKTVFIKWTNIFSFKSPKYFVTGINLFLIKTWTKKH